MLWKILHKLYGFDYVLVSGYSVCRVQYTPIGRAYVSYSGIIYFLDEGSGRALEPLTTKELPKNKEVK